MSVIVKDDFVFHNEKKEEKNIIMLHTKEGINKNESMFLAHLRMI